MIRIVVVDGNVEELTNNVQSAIDLLERDSPRAHRIVQRMLRRIKVADFVAHSIVEGFRTLCLSQRLVSEWPAEALALVLVYGATLRRLRPYWSRSAPADRRAQYWQRIAREVIDVAREIDRSRDPTSQVAGVSTGPWEDWARDWLTGAALSVTTPHETMWKMMREFQRLGLPKWLRRALTKIGVWTRMPPRSRWWFRSRV